MKDEPERTRFYSSFILPPSSLLISRSFAIDRPRLMTGRSGSATLGCQHSLERMNWAMAGMPCWILSAQVQSTMNTDEIQVGSVITGPLLPEPVEVLAIVPLGDSIKLIGKGCKTGLVRDPVLSPSQLAQLRCSPPRESFDGDPNLAWPSSPSIAWGIEAEGCSKVATRIAVSRFSRRSSGRLAAVATSAAQTVWVKVMAPCPQAS